MTQQTRKVERRNEVFAQRPATRIWQEIPSESNPYIAEGCRCHGYNLMELVEKRSFVDVLYLLFRGELPNPDQSDLLEKLMICLINPGPRHPATRAAMLAGVGKTDPSHIVPISLNVLSGKYLGTKEVEEGIRFLCKEQSRDPELVAIEYVDAEELPHPTPGFGNRFGGIDQLPKVFAQRLANLPGAGKTLIWGCDFAKVLNRYGMGWLATGVAAAVLADLGFAPRAGAGLFQIISAPGLLAHGVEMAYKPLTAMPFPTDEDYILED